MWSDLDVNYHVNNVKYVKWILEVKIRWIDEYFLTYAKKLFYGFIKYYYNVYHIPQVIGS